MENFKPSIDWGHEVVRSALWILGAWAACAAVVLVIAALLIRYTTWGQRFWRITGAYFTGAPSAPVWGLLAVMLLSVMIDVRIQVLLSYYSNDVYSALQVAVQGVASHNAPHRSSGIHGFWMALVIFCILATIHVARIVLDTYLAQRFIIRWRVWLTDRLTTNWLTGRAYYRDRFSATPIDNPDQRIQQDIDVFTTGVGTGPNVPTYYSTSIVVFGAVDALVSVASFTVILWRLSGPLTVFGVDLPKALFWIVLAYVLIASVIAFWIGRPLIRLSFRNEQTNAAFRYALVRLRESAEAVAFYRGERAEREQLDRPLRRRHRQLPAVRPAHHRVGRVELLGHPSGLARCRCSCRRRDCSPAPSSWATSPSPVPPSARSRAACRSSATPTANSPATTRSSCGWTASSRPANAPGICRPWRRCRAPMGRCGWRASRSARLVANG